MAVINEELQKKKSATGKEYNQSWKCVSSRVYHAIRDVSAHAGESVDLQKKRAQLAIHHASKLAEAKDID